MSRDPACLFCKIVHGEIPCAESCETEQAVAFLDINPVNKGHVLIVPIAASPPPWPTCRMTSPRKPLPRCCPGCAGPFEPPRVAEGLNVIVNIGSAAGQTIDHAHWHIIPRRGDDAVDWPWPHEPYVGDELNQMRFAIERELNGSDD